MAESSRWVNVVFNPGESTCVAVDPYGNAVTFVEGNRWTGQYFCINPLLHNEDREEKKASSGRRADANVTALRSILIEFDKRPLEDQVPYAVETMGLPYSVLTYSAGKSFHFLLCLDEPCESREDYRQLVERVYAALGGEESGLDTSTSNPSRFSRTPGAERYERENDKSPFLPTGKIQSLVDVRGRIPRAQLEDWLVSHGQLPRALREFKSVRKPGATRWRKPLPVDVRQFLEEGVYNGFNNTCYFTSCALVRAGYEADEIFMKIEKVTGYLEPVTIRTIWSAIEKAKRDIELEEAEGER